MTVALTTVIPYKGDAEQRHEDLQKFAHQVGCYTQQQRDPVLDKVEKN